MAGSPIYKRLGKAIASERERHSYTQQVLADAIGISRASVANIERGEQRVYLDQVLAMVSCFSLPNVDALLQSAPENEETASSEFRLSGDTLKRQEKQRVRKLLDGLLEA
jgi:transcriptional regulator with XRE-family HTH domain